MKIASLSNHSVVLAFFTLMSGLSGHAQAWEFEMIQSNHRHVDVSGTGTVYAAPEEVVVVLGVSTWNKDLRLCYKDNQQQIERVLGVATKHKIERQNIQLSEITVKPTYPSTKTGERDAKNPDGYRVEKDITIVVKNSQSVPTLLADAVENGANTIDSVEFRIENPRKFKDEARNLAIVAAKEKAEDMLKQLNCKLGKLLRIKEGITNITGLRDRYTYYPSANNNISSASQLILKHGEQIQPGDLATGQLRVTSEVTATFEIVD